jgi:NTP pyrophosphatase (non-canonical NTP hydrolase)
MSLGDCLSINIVKAVMAKIKLNQRKYPAKLCYGSIRKYTAYTTTTNISETTSMEMNYPRALSTLEVNDRNKFDAAMFGMIMSAIAFTCERGFMKFDTPRNLMFAVTLELGELTELLQWKGDTPQSQVIRDNEWMNIAEELADITIYVLKLHHSINVA